MWSMMQVALKGARALIKVFTDLHASVEDIQSWFSVGLEPVIGLVRGLTALVPCIILTLTLARQAAAVATDHFESVGFT